MEQLQVLESQIGIVKETIHIQVSSPEGKLLAIKDLLKDILNKSETRFYKSSDLEQKFAELNKLSSDIDAVELELNTILSEYQIFTNGEFSKWIGKLKDIGLTITPAIKPEFQKEMSLDQRIQAIIQVLDGGRILAKDVVEVVEPIYGIIKSFYDPSLPEKSLAVEFTMERLEGKEAPWIALEALYSSLNNWRRQYGREILASMNYLTNSLSSIANLTNQKEVLLDVFGDKAPLVFKYAKKAQDMKNAAVAKNQKTPLNLIDVISLKDNIQTFLTISKDVLSMLYSGLISQEQTIARLLPTQEHFWEKNTDLNEHLRKATETLANPSNYKINEIIKNMLKYLSHVDEAVQTLALYSERIEFLLNYPAAEAIIEELLKQRQQLTPKDLPFNPKFSAEYLRLYYTLRFSNYTFDKEEFVLKKRK